MRIIILMGVLAIATACGKSSNSPVITGEVIKVTAAGCGPDDVAVQIDNPNTQQYSFLCTMPTTPPVGMLNCTNVIIIQNAPAAFRVLGKKIKFSQWKDNNILCQSFSYAPHHLQVSDLTEN